MSANLDRVRSIYAAWETGDYRLTEWAVPEMEFVIADGPAPASGTGAPEVTAVWGDFLSAWEGFHHRADEYREIDGDRVLVLASFGGRGKTSGLELGRMATKGAVLFHLRLGEVTRIHLYLDRDRALADLGLAPRGE
jgi:ketosteroid isomerase-like protein